MKVRRGNVILDVKDDLKEYYLQRGYDIITAGGNVKQAAIPSDLATLQKAYVDHVAKIAELEKQLATVNNDSKKVTGRGRKNGNISEL